MKAYILSFDILTLLVALSLHNHHWIASNLCSVETHTKKDVLSKVYPAFTLLEITIYYPPEVISNSFSGWTYQLH